VGVSYLLARKTWSRQEFLRTEAEKSLRSISVTVNVTLSEVLTDCGGDLACSPGKRNPRPREGLSAQ